MLTNCHPACVCHTHGHGTSIMHSPQAEIERLGDPTKDNLDQSEKLELVTSRIIQKVIKLGQSINESITSLLTWLAFNLQLNYKY